MQWLSENIALVTIVFVGIIICVTIWIYLSGRSDRVKLSLKDGIELVRKDTTEESAKPSSPTSNSGVSMGSHNTIENSTFGTIVGGDQLVEGESGNVDISGTNTSPVQPPKKRTRN